MPRAKDKSVRRTAQGGKLYGEIKDTHQDIVRVARVALVNTELCRVTCTDDASTDQPLVLDKFMAAELVVALQAFIDDPDAAVKLV